jgi:hypothetical protein
VTLTELLDAYIPFGEADYYKESLERILSLLDEALESNDTDPQLSKLGDVRQILKAYSEYESASEKASPRDGEGNPRRPSAEELEAKRRAEAKLRKLLG